MAAAAVVALVPGLLSPLVGLWALLWVPAVLLGLAALLPREGRADPAPGDPAGDTAEAAPETARGARSIPGTLIRPVALPSAVDDHDLYFSAVVHWRWSGHVDLRLRNPVAPAVLSVVTRAAELIRGTDPAREGLAECELAALLAVECAVTGSGVVVWAEEVTLRLPDEDADRIRRLASLRKDVALREAMRDAEEELDEAAAAGDWRRLAAPGADALADRLPAPGTPDPAPLLDDLLPAPDERADEEPFGPGPVAAAPVPGSDVDGEGFESYWWPADDDPGGHDAAERDVQVAILRGLVDAVQAGPDREEFVREQVGVLELGGFDEVARRLREEYRPDRADTAPADGDSLGAQGNGV